MRAAVVLSLFAGLMVSSVSVKAQNASPSQAVPDIRTGTQAVIVDVVVQDKNGNSVHGLTKDDFVLTEKKQPQTLRRFEEQSDESPAAAGPTLPPQPPGTFTNYTPVPVSGALNILLIDSLNTPMTDQAFVRSQLQEYVKHAPEGKRIAIFGLAQQLYLLQGFTSDPTILRNAVEHKLIPRGSVLLENQVSSGQQVPALSDQMQEMADSGGAQGSTLQAIVDNLKQFEAENRALQTKDRVLYTLDAFNALAHFLSAFPGRKNVIWFSGSFPINIQPNPDVQSPFNAMEDNDEVFRETTDLLARAEVAVYPIDARGLMTNPVFSASAVTPNLQRHPDFFSRKIAEFGQSQAEEHSSMEQLANETGGRAFYNTNDLATAVRKSINAGSNYYTLMYSPSDHNWDGGFRDIRVSLARLPAADYQLSYRHGYYADDPFSPKKKSRTTASAVTTQAAEQSAAHGHTYVQAAMSHGAPTPQEILFKVRVLPASKVLEDKLPAANQADPVHPIKPPFRRYVIDFVLPAKDFSLIRGEDNKFHGAVEYSAFLFDNSGKLLNATGQSLGFDVKPEGYAPFQQSAARQRLEISAPAKGEFYLRLGIHDANSNRIGAVEVPLSQIAVLPPLPETPTPAPSPVPRQ